MTELQVNTDDALCAQIAPEMFFPLPNDSGTAKSAKRICARCPEVEVCLTVAIANDEIHGIWGGSTERERQLIRRGSRTKAVHIKELKERFNEDNTSKGKTK
ncbi:Transcription factor WhiB [uncultured Caudovirales phage]|uniref:Transcription factor WhiB n=1 Tax=uncultured Caudovirales phage TaxID=2100421 RepID=A0A6J7WMI3_9CAUD|nr:Transcription factor WhiB [uncultured Caudovirales phage]